MMGRHLSAEEAQQYLGDLTAQLRSLQQRLAVPQAHDDEVPGVQANAVDLQLRSPAGRPWLDIQFPVQLVAQVFGNPAFDLHLTSRLSLTANASVGFGWNPVNGLQPAASVVFGVAIHSQQQIPSPLEP